jgi:formylglycine-generating enzyme required for sulfatase activity
VVEIREFQRVAHEEHRGVVANEVPVALLRVELHRKAPDVAFSIGRATDNRVVRGGSWNFDPRFLRSAFRSRHVPAFRIVTIGFRCAQDAM